MEFNIPVPKIRLNLFRRKRAGVVDRDFEEFTQKLLNQMKEENKQLLTRSLAELRQSRSLKRNSLGADKGGRNA